MLITNDIVIILTLASFIIGMIKGIHLMRPHYYSGSRRRSSTGSRQYDD